MNYYLRFTDTPTEDLERGTSLLDLPSMKNTEVLSGLCGWKFADEYEFDAMTDEEIKSRIKMYVNNNYYSGSPTLFLGEYINNNPNGEGSIFTPISIV